MPVASCTPQTASAGNSWQGITCTSNNVIDQPVANCTPQAPTAGNGYSTITCNPLTTTDVPVASCSASIGGPGNNYVTTTCNINTTTNVPVASCTPVAPTAGNGYTTTTCPVINSGPTGATSCTPSGPTAGNNYVTTTCTNVTTGPTPVGSCTPVAATSGNGWTATTCTDIVTGPTLETVCTIANPSIANNFTRTTCVPASGSKIQFTTTTTEDTTFYSGGVPSGALPTVTTVTPLADVDGVCYAPNVAAPALPVPNPQPPAWTAADTTAFPSCSAWPCDVLTALSGARSVNSLADVAQYYYVTDLRKDADWPSTISTNDVPSVGSGAEDDRVRWQHMTTFTIALGVSGTLNYRPDYKSGSVVDRRLRRHPHRRARTGRCGRTRCSRPPCPTTTATRKPLEQPEVDRRLLAHGGQRPRHVLQRGEPDLGDRRPGRRAGRHRRHGSASGIGGGDVQPRAGVGRQPRST